eukprot:TRINITY_DN5715_c0_g2_i5.p1 TRINITY_DN5715_c0_g2~~TRINITY_DN5715_c0_g2_i5.p1  ORF type:complete len:429 (-),score=10.10 TRINITY_DN5715_c0_g2_i5:116-1402(-)
MVQILVLTQHLNVFSILLFVSFFIKTRSKFISDYFWSLLRCCRNTFCCGKLIKMKSQYISLALSGLIRAILIVYGEWQDAQYEVGFTDVDYKVFTDSSNQILTGSSPYQQPTYRYSPLFALFLIPNLLVMNCFGKLLFCGADLIVGYQLWWFAKNVMKTDDKNANIVQCLWLFNVPFVAVISARGSSDSITVMLILMIIQLASQKRAWMCGVVWGIAVHLRVFPVIYGPLLAIQFGLLRLHEKYNLRQLLKLAMGAAASFTILGILFYYLYGHEFIQQTYLYHLQRKDMRHNFSVYFYGTYLSGEDGNFGWIAFPLQMSLISFISYVFKEQLELSFVLITIIFVGFNKVITAQYFTWFYGLLPLIYPNTKLEYGLIVWILAQVNWLYWAYNLEFLGQQVFFQVWLSSIGMFFGHISLLCNIMLTWQYK